MKIVRTSISSGITRTREIDVTEEQMHLFLNGKKIHLAMPNLSEDDREFILTGMTAEEWDEAFPDE